MPPISISVDTRKVKMEYPSPPLTPSSPTSRRSVKHLNSQRGASTFENTRSIRESLLEKIIQNAAVKTFSCVLGKRKRDAEAEFDNGESMSVRTQPGIRLDPAATVEETVSRFHKTGYISIHDAPIIITTPDKPPRKSRKGDDGNTWRLKGDDIYRPWSPFRYDTFDREGPSQERFTYTMQQYDSKTEALQDVEAGLLVARQRPLLNMPKSKAGMFNVVNVLNGQGKQAKYKLLRAPSLVSRMKPRGLKKFGEALSPDVRRMSPVKLAENKKRLESEENVAHSEIEETCDPSDVFNSAASISSKTTAAEIMTEYSPTERLDTTSNVTHTPIRKQMSSMPLRESVLIAQETRWTCPLRHGEKASLYLDSEFFYPLPRIGYLSSNHWMRTEVIPYTQWRRKQLKELVKLSKDNDGRFSKMRALTKQIEAEIEEIERVGFLSDEEGLGEKQAALEALVREWESVKEEVSRRTEWLELKETPIKDWDDRT